MIATENPEAAAALMDRVRSNRPARDHSKLHLSDVLGCARAAWFKRNNPDSPLASDESDHFTLITMLGEGHHGLVGGATKAEKSWDIDGLLCTPDELVKERKGGKEDQLIVVEYKTTRKSANKGINDLDSYVEQLGGYCALLGTPYGRLHVFFLVGAYRPPTPIHKVWDIEFAPHELAHWRRELSRRRALIESARSMESIPVAENHPWRCAYCGLKDRVCPGGGERTVSFPNVVLA